MPSLALRRLWTSPWLIGGPICHFLPRPPWKYFQTPLKPSRLTRVSTKGQNLASVQVGRVFIRVFIRVHFVLRPVRSYILAIFWYFLGPNFKWVIASLSFNILSRVMYQRDTRVCFSALEGIWCTFWLAVGSVVGKKSEIRSAFLQNKCLAALEMEGRTCQAFGFNLHCKNRAATVVGNKL